MSSKLIVTYKRKRALTLSHLSNGTHTDSCSSAPSGGPKPEAIIVEKLDEDNLPPICANEGDFNEPMHQETNKEGTKKCTKGTGKGSVEICNTLHCVKAPSSEKSSGFKTNDTDTAGRSDQVSRSPGNERKCHPVQDCASVRPSTHQRHSELVNDEPRKGVGFNSMITFSRRVKRKPDVGEALLRSHSKTEDKQHPQLSQIRASCEYEGSNRTCSLQNPSSTTPLVLEQNDVITPHVLQPDQDSTAEKDSELGFTPADTLVEPRNTTTTIPSFGYQNQAPGSTEKVRELISDVFVAATGESALVHERSQSTTIGEELGNKTNYENDPDRLTTPDNVPEKREKHCNKGQPINLSSCGCLPNSDFGKSFIEMAQKDPIESSGLEKSCSIVVVDEETVGRDKELEWLETLDKALQERKKKACLVTEHISVNGTEEVPNRKSTEAFPANSYIRSQHNQGDIFWTNECDTVEKQHYQTDFHGLPGQLNYEGASSSRFAPSTSLPQNFSVRVGVHEHNTELHRNIILENSVFRRKQVLDNVVGGIDASSNQRYSYHWSEEELDFLWVGVRRYGLNNWQAILKDPRLCFSKLRAAEDLAEQWEIEQRKLLNSTLYQPRKAARLDVPPFTDDAVLPKSYGNGTRSACLEFPTLTNETELSLGDLYLQNDSSFKRSLRQSLALTVPDLPGSSQSFFASSFLMSSLPASSSYARVGIRHQNASKFQSTKYQCRSSWVQESKERSAHELRSAQPANSKLPHWLRNVLGTPIISSHASDLLSSVSLLNNDQQIAASASNLQKPNASNKESQERGILKRTNATSTGKVCGMRAFDCSTTEQRIGHDRSVTCQNPESITTGYGAKVGLDLNKRSDVVDLSDVVVIDSDASSEETISDDRSL